MDEDELADALQSAILGSVLPFLTEAGSRRVDDKGSRHGSGALTLLLGIGIGVGVAAWARKDDGASAEPLPEDEEWELVNGPSTRIVKSAINDTLDKADAVIRRLAKAAAETMGAAVSTVADAAGPTAELVTDKLRVARDRATSEVIRTLDDLDAVWDDDGADSEPLHKKPVAKKPIPRKPVVGRPSTSKPSSSTSPKGRTPSASRGRQKSTES